MTRSPCLRSAAIAGLTWGLWFAATAAPADIERGRQLFNGEAPLAGRITGHTTDLPAQASRCANCHAAGTAPPAVKASAAPSALAGAAVNAAASAAPTSFGPALNADLLSREMPRRGGPPSRYDEQAFCKLLSTGIDPAYIIIPRNMPRYTLPAADCRALWLYLSQPRR